MSTTTLLNKEIGSTGYGMMGLTWRDPRQPEEDSIKVMKAALEKGSNFWNAGVLYGSPEYNSLHLLNAYFTKYPEDASKVVICVKGAFNPATHSPDGSPEYLRKEIEESLKILDGKCKIDIFECARVDMKTPIEVSIKALDELVKEGKIGAIGLSEVGEATIRKAAEVATIASVEVEFSLYSTDILTNGVGKACTELNIPIIAYSPLSRGFLTGGIRKHSDIPPGDMRRNLPRFSPENFDSNLRLLEEVEKLAKTKGCTPGNIAIAWVKAMSGRPGLPTIIPIPGTTTVERLDENMRDVALSEQDLRELGEAVEKCEVVGGRYGGPLAKLMWA